MSRTARREKVTHPIAVQITVPRAMRPVMPRNPLVFEAISCTCAGVKTPPSSRMRFGM